MSLTKDEAAEVKRLAEEYVDDAIYMENPERDSGVSICNYEASQKAFWAYIDSLTQPAPELTDGELGDAIFSAVASMPMNLAAYPSRLYVARAVIAADRSKRGTV